MSRQSPIRETAALMMEALFLGVYTTEQVQEVCVHFLSLLPKNCVYPCPHKLHPSIMHLLPYVSHMCEVYQARKCVMCTIMLGGFFFDALYIDSSTQMSVCTHGEVRLANGPNPNEGRVEVCINNAWGTVCHNEFSSEDAKVICRDAGFPAQGE